MSNRRCDRLVRQPSITDSSSGESIDSEGSDDVESGRGDDSIHTAMKNSSSPIPARILKGNISITATTSALKVAGLTTRVKALRAMTRMRTI